MNIQEKIIKEYPLMHKINCDLNCYIVNRRRYLIFWEAFISKESIGSILKCIQEKTNNPSFSKWKTLIIVGTTNDTFSKKELFYFDNINTFVVFYLVSQEGNKIYMNDSWIFPIGYNYKKYVRKINSIIAD